MPNQLQEYKGQMLGTTSDGETRKIAIDKITNATKIITSDHSSIHMGNGFAISGIFSGVANSSTVAYGFKTPSVASGKYIHLKFREFSASGNKVRIDFYENPTNAPTVGVDFTAYNRNRNSSEVSQMQSIKVNISGLDLTGATMIDSSQFISNSARPWIS